MTEPLGLPPRIDGRRILVKAEIMAIKPENAFNGWVTAAWSEEHQRFVLSPSIEGVEIDSDPTEWAPLPGDNQPPPANEFELRGKLIRDLEAAMHVAEVLNDPETTYLIDRAVDQARASQFRARPPKD